MQNSNTAMRISDVSYTAALRSQARVVEILGGPHEFKNPKVIKVGIEVRANKPVVVVYLKKGINAPNPVLPAIVAGIPTAFESVEGEVEQVREAGYMSNRQRMFVALKKVSHQLAMKFSATLSRNWPPSFSISETNRVVIATITSPIQDDAFLISVKVLGQAGSEPLWSQDITIDQMTKAEAIADFISSCEASLAQFHSTIAG